MFVKKHFLAGGYMVLCGAMVALRGFQIIHPALAETLNMRAYNYRPACHISSIWSEKCDWFLTRPAMKASGGI